MAAKGDAMSRAPELSCAHAVHRVTLRSSNRELPLDEPALPRLAVWGAKAMTRGNPVTVKIAWVLSSLAFVALGGCRSGDEAAEGLGDGPKDAGSRPVRGIISVSDVPNLSRASLEDCEKRLARWSQGRDYEKLMIAEELLPLLTSEETCEDAADHEPTRGGNDLSRVAGRAKWCLERTLGVSLPNVRADSSPQELEKLREEATKLVEAYRSEIMARAQDQRVSPAAFAELKRKYPVASVPDGSNNPWGCINAMENLLGEWPPIGRKYEDLASIIGVKAQRREDYAEGAVVYRIDTGHFGIAYFFIVRDGIIRSVRLFTFT